MSVLLPKDETNTTQGVPRNRTLQHHILRKCSNVCKIGTCSHEVGFGQHYDHSVWKVYAEKVRSSKSVTVIDPDCAA